MRKWVSASLYGSHLPSHPPVCPSIHPSTNHHPSTITNVFIIQYLPSICPSIHHAITTLHLSIHPSVDHSITTLPPVHPSISSELRDPPSIHLSIYPFIHYSMPTLRLSIHPSYTHPSICTSITHTSTSICPSILLSNTQHPPLHLSIIHTLTPPSVHLPICSSLNTHPLLSIHPSIYPPPFICPSVIHPLLPPPSHPFLLSFLLPTIHPFIFPSTPPTFFPPQTYGETTALGNLPDGVSQKRNKAPFSWTHTPGIHSWPCRRLRTQKSQSWRDRSRHSQGWGTPLGTPQGPHNRSGSWRGSSRSSRCFSPAKALRGLESKPVSTAQVPHRRAGGMPGTVHLISNSKHVLD